MKLFRFDTEILDIPIEVTVYGACRGEWEEFEVMLDDTDVTEWFTYGSDTLNKLLTREIDDHVMDIDDETPSKYDVWRDKQMLSKGAK